jgi:tryptophan-rich hypothetical protein
MIDGLFFHDLNQAENLCYQRDMKQRPRIRITPPHPPRPPNRFSRLKLPGSKWTDLQPSNQEKHFVVHDWTEAQSEELEIEAVQSHRFYKIHWKALKNADKWQMGWH